MVFSFFHLESQVGEAVATPVAFFPYMFEGFQDTLCISFHNQLLHPQTFGKSESLFDAPNFGRGAVILTDVDHESRNPSSSGIPESPCRSSFLAACSPSILRSQHPSGGLDL
ncbi:uncharacterized protein LOC120135101 [Hibiscus syriacus]|uniref:uncharacterized protein LOC120135101 n=1 Tax=Hibiscus syriacus TaxID=106335 RepID=UPI001922136B|nr:uncharacterized protein LOC120135101 [Hibiscus syriacus]